MTHILELETLKKQIISSSNLFRKIPDESKKYEIAIKIIEKLISILTELEISKNDLHKQAITFRYSLETLIISKLLVQEENYFLKLYFSLFTQQENKTEEMIKRIKYEISILEQYKDEFNNDIKANQEKYKNDIPKLSLSNEEIFKKYQSKIQDNVNIYYSKLNDYGFDFLILSLKKQILLPYTNKLKEFNNLKLLKAQELAKAEWFNKYFNTRKQHSKVFSLLRDTRPWKVKAKITGYESEYTLNYESTSSLLHFTSYSIFTQHHIKDEEIQYNNMVLSQYLNKIIINLKLFCKTTNFNIIQV